VCFFYPNILLIQNKNLPLKHEKEHGCINGVNSTWTPNKKGLPISLRKF